jgi:glycosyltransferase involved in cell wall biosynthesis
VRHLLVVNYVLDEDDPVLAWQLRVVCELAARVEQVTVLTERRGRADLPDNVRVLQLPHRPYRVPRRLGGGWLAAPRVLRELRADAPDACFVHMAAEWLYRLGWVLRRLHVPVVLWYAHGTVTRRLRLAVAYADLVVTSTPEGFRLDTPKKRVIGQGIDVERFRRPGHSTDGNVVLSVGRLSRRKRVELVVDALAAAMRLAPERRLRLRLVGPPITKGDEEYGRELRRRAERLGIAKSVEWVGFVPHELLAEQYRDVFLHLNLSETGSMDKTVMEALAAGTPVLTSNPAFRSVLSEHPEMLLDRATPDYVAERILLLHDARANVDEDSLKKIVLGRHDLASYADRILDEVRSAIALREGG